MTNLKRFALAIAAVGMVVVASMPILAQHGPTGGITGIVKDATGAAVVDADVEVINERTRQTDRRVRSGGEGIYTATALAPGTYTVQVTLVGFRVSQATGVLVRVNETTRLDVTLEVGDVRETVFVEATPSIINPVSPTTGLVTGGETLSSLPLPTPNFMFLLTLSTGTAGEMPDVRAAGRGNVDINVHGQRTTNNSMTLEGVNVNDFNLAHFDTVPLPTPAVLQEFKVATSLYDASLGSKGGGAVNVVFKEGSSQWHGEVYWNHRNDVLNANEWFFNQVGREKGRLLQNVYGGTGSGPIPKLGGFWLFNLQGVRGRNGIDPAGATMSPVIPRIPTAADGTTTAALLVADPIINPGGALTAADIDPVALNILNLQNNVYGTTFFIPRLGAPGCQSTATAAGTFRCTIGGIIEGDGDQFTIGYDRNLRGSKDKIRGRFFWDTSGASRPFGGGATLNHPSAIVQNNRFVSVSYVLGLSARQTNEIRAGYTRFINSIAPTDLISLTDIGQTRPNESVFPGMSFFSITGLFTAGVAPNDDRGTISNTYSLKDDWSYLAGKHTIRAGGEALRYELNRFNNFLSRGNFTFGASTDGPGFTPLQNFLRGAITGVQAAGLADLARNYSAHDFSFYVQDDWRIHPRVTLNLGLRWEILGFSHDRLYRNAIYDAELLRVQPARSPFIFPEKLDFLGFRGLPGVKDCALDKCYDYNNLAPRLGFAWDMFGNQKTVLRGGYGIYYQRVSNQNLLQGSLIPPLFTQVIESRTASPTPGLLGDPLAGVAIPSGVSAAGIGQAVFFAGLFCESAAAGCPTLANGQLDPNAAGVRPMFVNENGVACSGWGGTAGNCAINLMTAAVSPRTTHAPYTQHWNLTLQREFWRGWVVEAGYIGTHYIGGLGIWRPYLPVLAGPSDAITVTDINGVTHTVTTNTARNEALRSPLIGVSGARGTRFADNVGTGIYHSGQLTLSRSFSGGLYVNAGYTYAKTIDNVSGSMSGDELNATRAGQAGANLLNFQNDPRSNRARGDFDRRHRFVTSFVWDLPLPKSGVWGSQAFQGWQISGIVTFQDGLPFSVFDSTSGTAFGATGIGTGIWLCSRASDAYTSGSDQDRVGGYLNPACFGTAGAPDNLGLVPNQAGGATGYGTVPRNAFRGPFQQNWDFGIAKKFTFMERHTFQFRAEFFNIWNHPIFREPGSSLTIGTATLGVITQTAIPSRLIQFSLKYAF